MKLFSSKSKREQKPKSGQNQPELKKEKSSNKMPILQAKWEDLKSKQLEENHVVDVGEKLTTNQGVGIVNNQDTLKAGENGPSLLEDFIFREKITNFDHERIPERAVHARGAGAHGYFESYGDHSDITSASFLSEKGKKTPLFLRFSTVAGSRGSADTARDVRGFAVKFYTDEGIFDLVGNNIPVFFIQDAIKFPDLIHSVKPEPHNEIPQAASAHDTFYDFISNSPETMHMLMWVMSDRAIPRSFSMMEGFGIHTFRFINKDGVSKFVKFHFKPKLGVHGLVWDEAQKLAGKNADFHRQDMWDQIENGNYPEWEFGVQVLGEDELQKIEFDITDPTKIWPEEDVPVRILGKMVLNRNTENYFAETEQVAFCPAHLVPGIDFSNDPLLQGRLFSYLDTQISRLGSANFAQIPINRPVNPVRNNQRDGHMQMRIAKGITSYEPNSIAQNKPAQVSVANGGFMSYPERIDATKIRAKAESFKDHYTQARLFFQSMTQIERNHIINALSFELSLCKHDWIKQKMIDHFNKIHAELATKIALNLGFEAPKTSNANEAYTKTSKALSTLDTMYDDISGRKVAIILGEGFDYDQVKILQKVLENGKAQSAIISKSLGKVKASNGEELKVDMNYPTAESIMFDAVFIPSGSKLSFKGFPAYFVNEAFDHCKSIAFVGTSAKEYLKDVMFIGDEAGVFVTTDAKETVEDFITKFASQITRRHYSRQIDNETRVI